MRDDTKNGCAADYLDRGLAKFARARREPQAAQAQYESTTWKLGIKEVGKITTQEARRHQVNKVKRIFLKIHASIYLFESIT